MALLVVIAFLWNIPEYSMFQKMEHLAFFSVFQGIFHIPEKLNTSFALSAEAISMIATRRPHSPPNIHKIPILSIYKNKKIYKTLLIY